MAGEIILRSKIENLIAKYLDRKDDPVILDIVGNWFVMAHRKAQRLFNFSIMEGDDKVITMEEGDYYVASPLMKEPLEATLSEDTVVDNVSTGTTAIRRYIKKDHDTVLRYIDDGMYHGSIFCMHNSRYLLWPPTTSVTPNTFFYVHGYMFQPTPATDEHDWFTDYGSDYLLYQSLVESVDYVGAPEGRALTWQARAKEALDDLMNMNTQLKISGLMSVR